MRAARVKTAKVATASARIVESPLRIPAPSGVIAAGSAGRPQECSGRRRRLVPRWIRRRSYPALQLPATCHRGIGTRGRWHRRGHALASRPGPGPMQAVSSAPGVIPPGTATPSPSAARARLRRRQKAHKGTIVGGAHDVVLARPVSDSNQLSATRRPPRSLRPQIGPARRRRLQPVREPNTGADGTIPMALQHNTKANALAGADSGLDGYNGCKRPC